MTTYSRETSVPGFAFPSTVTELTGDLLIGVCKLRPTGRVQPAMVLGFYYDTAIAVHFCTVYGGFQVIRVESGSCDKASAVWCPVAKCLPTLCEPMGCSTLGFQGQKYLSGPFQNGGQTLI